MRLYLNGREVAAAHAEGPLSTYPTPLVMGAYGNLPHNATYCLAGALDEVALYDRALRAQEIGEYYWQAQHDLVLSRPGNGEAFGRVADDHAAFQPFTALGPSLESAAIWLCEANDDELQVQVRESNAEGRVLGIASLSAGPVGKRSILFDPPVSLRTDHVYVLRVSAGAPGTTRGTVQRQVSGAGTKGLTEIGPSEHSMAIELRFLPCVIRSVARARSRRPKTEADIRYEERQTPL
jgi:hypothetical protein